MSYEKRHIGYFTKKRAIFVLTEELGIKEKYVQRLMDRGMVYLNGEVLRDKSMIFTGDIEIIEYVPQKTDLYPLFEYKDLLFYDKPSGLLTHPRGRKVKPSLLDSMRLIGRDVNPTHRLDKQTSGILIASKSKESERYMKMLFENRGVKKSYLAYLVGRVKSQMIDIPIKRREDDCVNNIMVEDKSGKESKTELNLLDYDATKDISLVELIPHTGRTHQLRVHSYLIGHKVVGDMTYGITNEEAIKFLDEELTESQILEISRGNRLMLHSNKISFEYDEEFIELDNTNSFNSIHNRDKITII